MIHLLRSALALAIEAPTLRRDLATARAHATTMQGALDRSREAFAALEADCNAWALAARKANLRLDHAPTPSTLLVDAWTLGGSAAAIDAASGGNGTRYGRAFVTSPPTYESPPTLADLGSTDAAEIHRAKGCGTEAMRRAWLTMSLAGVQMGESWAKWGPR